MSQRKIPNTTMKCDKSQFVEKELQDKIELWMLRIIINLGGHREFIDKDNDLRREEVAYFLGLEKYLALNSSDYTRKEVMDLLKSNLIKLENKKSFTTSKVLAKNIKNISNLMNLNTYEKQILEFVVLLNQYEVLDDASDFLGRNVNSSQTKRAIASILNIPLDEVKKAFTPNSKFSKSSLLSIYKNTNNLKSKIDTLSDDFIDNMLNLDEDIEVMIRDSVRPCNKSDLSLKDYTHIKKDVDILIPYLKSAIKNKNNGVNILLYGLPGTGKTELAKTISQTIKTNLFEIS